MLYDISPPISPQLAVWPGDAPFTRDIEITGEGAAAVTSSIWHTTAHVGAHADAFSHTLPAGATIEDMNLAAYLGPCRVMHLDIAARTAIEPNDLPDELDTPRVLLATGTYPDSNDFNADFAALSSELAERLAAVGTQLIGIDTPSVDLFTAKGLPAHRILARAKIATLEGLRLADVPPGVYELIALPLRIASGDASPVRAVLRTLE